MLHNPKRLPLNNQSILLHLRNKLFIDVLCFGQVLSKFVLINYPEKHPENKYVVGNDDR